MRVRVNGTDMFHYDNTVSVEPINKKGQAFLVVDPGKTNMACLVGNPFGNIYKIFEFSGSDDFERMYTGGGPEDTSLYCKEFRDFLVAITKELDIVIYGIEQAVKYKGQEYYHSQMTLTEIRGSLISFGMDILGYKPEEINNETWKSHVLPHGYNKRGQKGSYEYLKTKGFAQYTHDVTDVVCMYLYLCRKYSGKFKIRCDVSEKALEEYSYLLFPKDSMELGQNYKPFIYNEKFSLKDNLNYYINRTVHNGTCTVPVECLTMEDIYGHAMLFDDIGAEDATVVVSR